MTGHQRLDQDGKLRSLILFLSKNTETVCKKNPKPGNQAAILIPKKDFYQKSFQQGPKSGPKCFPNPSKIVPKSLQGRLWEGVAHGVTKKTLPGRKYLRKWVKF